MRLSAASELFSLSKACSAGRVLITYPKPQWVAGYPRPQLVMGSLNWKLECTINSWIFKVIGKFNTKKSHLLTFQWLLDLRAYKLRSIRRAVRGRWNRHTRKETKTNGEKKKNSWENWNLLYGNSVIIKVTYFHIFSSSNPLSRHVFFVRLVNQSLIAHKNWLKQDKDGKGYKDL